MVHISTKTYGHDIGLSACFRQWKTDSHCKYLHGYALAVRIEFEADELDERNWVVDFGGLKSFKTMLENTFDHRLLVAEDDPALTALQLLGDVNLAQIVVVPATGCEAFAQLIYEYAAIWLYANGYAHRVKVRSVEVKEHGANSAIYMEDKFITTEKTNEEPKNPEQATTGGMGSI
jgi:6-pyruvoyltetrahydropterin/6-carboxytetrahydropterin synthase